MSKRTEQLDRMAPEAALRALEQGFPGWLIWTGTDHRCHAATKSGPVVRVSGEDPVDLRDEITRAEAFLEAW